MADSTKTYDFSTEGDYSFTSTDAQLVDGVGKLKLQDYPSQTFSEDYMTDDGFTYNSNLLEFVPSSSEIVAYATYNTDDNFNFDFSTGTVTGTPGGGNNTGTVSDGSLNLNNDDYSFVAYDMTGTGISTKGCIEFTFTPNYSGTSTEAQYIFEALDSAGKSRASLTHTLAGNLRWWFTDVDGFTIVSADIAAWSPTSGVDYVMSVNWDTATEGGELKFFLDGVQQGSTITGLYNRNELTDFVIGNRVSPGASNDANFSIDNIEIYNTPQRTGNYTPSAFSPAMKMQQKLQTGELNDYLESYAVSPLQTAVGSPDGTIVSFQSWDETSSSNVKYTINTPAGIAYWYNATSQAWEVSDQSYVQANSAADIENYYSSSIPAITTTFKYGIAFPASNTQENTSNLSVEYTHQLYPTDDPLISVASAARIYSEGYTSFDATIIEGTSGTGIKFIMVLDGTKTYWNGSAWVASNGTYAQSNTAEDVNTNIATLSTTSQQFGIDVVLHTDDGLYSPSIDEIVIVYDESLAPPSSLPTLVDINGYIYNGTSAYESLTLLVRPYGNGFQNPNTGVGGGVFHVYKWKTLATTASDGYFSGNMYLQPNGEYWEIKIEKQRYKFQLPDQAAVDFNTLTLTKIED